MSGMTTPSQATNIFRRKRYLLLAETIYSDSKEEETTAP